MFLLILQIVEHLTLQGNLNATFTWQGVSQGFEAFLFQA